MKYRIIDKRSTSSRGGHVPSQERLKRELQKEIQDAINEKLHHDTLESIGSEKGKRIKVRSKRTHEPHIRRRVSGRTEQVHPGNKDYMRGDKIPRPEGGAGGGTGPGQASKDGHGEDDFVFEISSQEFLDHLFDGCELPNAIKKALSNTDFSRQYAGIVNDGPPCKTNWTRSTINRIGRRTALSMGKRRKIRELQEMIIVLMQGISFLPDDERMLCLEQIGLLEEEVKRLKGLVARVPYWDTYDLAYHYHDMRPTPTTKAVMFCLMDVSGSMSRDMKDLAKRFFILLYLFLKRNYERTEVVFIRHHTTAKVVDEQEFFYSRETGGTIVSSVLLKMEEVIQQRFPLNEWNIYGCHASDGDSWSDDNPLCREVLERLLDVVQYYGYIETRARGPGTLWKVFEGTAAYHDNFQMAWVKERKHIYPVFRKLFEKKEVSRG